MAQNDSWGPAESLHKYRRGIQRIMDFIQREDAPRVTPDTSWHDSMVRKANESFREAARKRQAARKGTDSARRDRRRDARKDAPGSAKRGR